MSEKKYEIANRTDVEFFNLLQMVKEDWIEQVREMGTLELAEDRTDWIKKFGIRDEDTEKVKFLIDIHSLAIQLEQIRRFGGIVYDV